MGQKVKLLLLLIIALFAINLASAASLYLDLDIVTPKQGDCFNIFESCDNCSYMNITIIYPNGTPIVENQAMTNLSSTYYYNYSFCDTSILGVYPLIIYYDKDLVYTYSDTDFFRVTYNGHSISEGQAILYVGFLALLVIILVINFVGMHMLPARNTKDEEGRILSISYLKYFRNILWMTGWMLFIAILYLSSNLAFAYLTEQMFAKFFFMLFQITFGLTPVIVIVWMIWIIVSMFHDKQLQGLLNRGMFPQGRL